MGAPRREPNGHWKHHAVSEMTGSQRFGAQPTLRELDAKVLADIVEHPDESAVSIAVRLGVDRPKVTRSLTALLHANAITRERPKGWPYVYRATKEDQTSE